MNAMYYDVPNTALVANLDCCYMHKPQPQARSPGASPVTFAFSCCSCRSSSLLVVVAVAVGPIERDPNRRVLTCKVAISPRDDPSGGGRLLTTTIIEFA